MLPLLIAAATAATPGPSWVLVDRESWILLDGDGHHRLRAAVVAQAPPHNTSPVVVLEKVGEVGDLVRVRTVPMAGTVSRQDWQGDLGTPPEGWRHCYAQPPGIAQLQIDGFVRKVDLLPVLLAPATVTTPDGGEVRLDAGLALQGGQGGRWRVLGEHTTLTVDLPHAQVGRAYGAGVVMPTHADRWSATRAEEGGGTYVIDATWRSRFRALDGTVALAGGEVDPSSEPAAAAIHDRCLDIRTSQPVAGVPRQPPPSGAVSRLMPILVPEGTQVSWTEAEVIGRVAGSELVVWSRATCTLGETTICCDPLPGVETLDHHGATAPICAQATLPERKVSQDLTAIYERVQDNLTSRVGTTWDLANHADFVWLTPKVSGDLSPKAIEAFLLADYQSLQRCYIEALQRDIHVAGELSLRFGLQSDGLPSGVRAIRNDTGDIDLAACVTNRIAMYRILDQIGKDPATVTLDLTFLPPRLRDEEVAPAADPPAGG